MICRHYAIGRSVISGRRRNRRIIAAAAALTSEKRTFAESMIIRHRHAHATFDSLAQVDSVASVSGLVLPQPRISALFGWVF